MFPFEFKLPPGQQIPSREAIENIANYQGGDIDTESEEFIRAKNAWLEQWMAYKLQEIKQENEEMQVWELLNEQLANGFNELDISQDERTAAYDWVAKYLIENLAQSDDEDDDDNVEEEDEYSEEYDDDEAQDDNDENELVDLNDAQKDAQLTPTEDPRQSDNDC